MRELAVTLTMTTTTDGTNPCGKRHFLLAQDDDGYPPANVETRWVIVRGSAFEVDNVPFFVKEVSVGDLVRAETREGALWFAGVERASDHSTLRIIVVDPQLMQRVRDELRSLGCTSELSHLAVLAAVDVPPKVDLDRLLDRLEPLRESGDLDLEVASLRHRSRRW